MSHKVVAVALTGSKTVFRLENRMQADAKAKALMTRNARSIRQVSIFSGKREVARWRAYTQWHPVITDSHGDNERMWNGLVTE